MASSRSQSNVTSSVSFASTSAASHPSPSSQRPQPKSSRTTTCNRTRTSTGRRPTTEATTTTNPNSQEIIVGLSESRGIAPIVGLAILNLSSAEVVLCQICDTQTYVRTIHKLSVFGPTEILFANTAQGSKLYGAVQENLHVDEAEVLVTCIDRKYWNETAGFDYIRQLALPEDIEALKVILGGNYYAANCFSAVMKYVELSLSKTFVSQSLRIRFEPSQGSTMIDMSTITSLELIQNSQNAKSKHCLLGLLNETLTPMGSRILKSNILQPSTDVEKLQARYDAVEELSSKEHLFHSARDALKRFVDTDRVLSDLVIMSTKIDFQHAEQSINNIVQLKTFVDAIKPIWQALTGASSEELVKIRSLCAPARFENISNLIKDSLNDDVAYSTQPLELRNQRIYAVKAGVNGFLDVARQTYKEANEDAFSLANELNETHNLSLDLKFESARSFYFRFPQSALDDGRLPREFINVFRKKGNIDCQTLALMKINQKITDAHNEVVNMSDATVQQLIEHVRAKIAPLFKISESVALLDMLVSFAQVVTTGEYMRPELTPALAIKAGRHPLMEKIRKGDRFVPNDVYATQQSRFQIITGCNMSGKSTYIRSIALMSIMAQIGCFVPAQYASFPIIRQIFTRVSTDDNIEANVSSFSAEMREMAFILANVEPKSLVLVDELGRGTGTTDGLSIAIAIAEALIDSGALVWFVTHFRELPRILSERAGVVSLHLAVDLNPSRMRMLYKIEDGPEEQRGYGIALAKVVDMPTEVITIAEEVSQRLSRKVIARANQDQRSLAIARRRKLVLSLKEQLMQARQGVMRGEDLRQWLKKLQDEFVVRMTAIDAEARTQADAMEDDRTEGTIEDIGSLGRLDEEVASISDPSERQSIKPSDLFLNPEDAGDAGISVRTSTSVPLPMIKLENGQH